MSGVKKLPAAFLKPDSTLRLFSLNLVVGSFETFCSNLVDWLIKTQTNKYLSQPSLAIMVVSMQDIIANRFRPQVKAAIKSFDVLTMDGMPLVWMAKILGYPAERMYGPEIMEAVLNRTRNLPVSHFFYGGQPASLNLLKKNLKNHWPNLIIAGQMAPPFRPLVAKEKLAIIKTINDSGADVVWVGLGSWKQLLWVAEFKSALKAKLIIPVGMAFDLMAGTKKQAPVWLRQAGGEWLFRLWSEPARLWSRYWWQVPYFGAWWVIELINKWTKANVAGK